MTAAAHAAAPSRAQTAQPHPETVAQLSTNFDADHKARNSDPETSKAAARRTVHFATSHAGRILLALQQHGPMSPKRLFDFTGLSVVQIDRRRLELIRAGLVRIKKADDGATMTHDGCEILEAVRA
ncbi:hypothetical protein [uncultured Ramlibacter sp.]|uniref:hypothetical protein n=1 Tax=uncultured Ramlibacter sp. TaxID=260755 RepID=UPI00260BF4FE|nr:hypothetical protein [uncultured Ramlibacter sp.]